MADPISSLEMTIRTGDDELRGDSTATAYVIVSHGGSTRRYSTIRKKKSVPVGRTTVRTGPLSGIFRPESPTRTSNVLA
jgi:hypothetical protein